MFDPLLALCFHVQHEVVFNKDRKHGKKTKKLLKKISIRWRDYISFLFLFHPKKNTQNTQEITQHCCSAEVDDLSWIFVLLQNTAPKYHWLWCCVSTKQAGEYRKPTCWLVAPMDLWTNLAATSAVMSSQWSVFQAQYENTPAFSSVRSQSSSSASVFEHFVIVCLFFSSLILPVSLANNG